MGTPLAVGELRSASRSNGGVTSVVARTTTTALENTTCVMAPAASARVATTSATSPREIMPTPTTTLWRLVRPATRAPKPHPTIFETTASTVATTIECKCRPDVVQAGLHPSSHQEDGTNRPYATTLTRSVRSAYWLPRLMSKPATYAPVIAASPATCAAKPKSQAHSSAIPSRPSLPCSDSRHCAKSHEISLGAAIAEKPEERQQRNGQHAQRHLLHATAREHDHDGEHDEAQ